METAKVSREAGGVYRKEKEKKEEEEEEEKEEENEEKKGEVGIRWLVQLSEQ